MIGSGKVSELILLDGAPFARITCDSGLVPAPGQYLMAHRPGSDSQVADILFRTALTADGFVAVTQLPSDWIPGTTIDLRGPLGHGFAVPERAARIALVALDESARRVLALLESAKDEDAAFVLVCASPPDELPLHLEVQPLSALRDVLAWAEYAAIDAARASLPRLGQLLDLTKAGRSLPVAQVLVRAPMPCGALAECGVCAVRLRKGVGLACDDGPVFDLDLLDLEGQ